MDLSCGGHHCVCVSSTGRVHVWGCNNHGQLGLGDRNDRATPTMLAKLRKHRIMQVAAGWRHSLVLTDGNVMYAWGMFSAVKHQYPRSMHDPDADNTQFETHIPLEVPFNSVTSSTTQQRSTKRSQQQQQQQPISHMPSLRSIQGISCASSRTLSLTTIQWQQKPGPERMLRQPLLHHSLTVSNKEADNLLLDHKVNDPGYAYNLQQLSNDKDTKTNSDNRTSRGTRSIQERGGK